MRRNRAQTVACLAAALLVCLALAGCGHGAATPQSTSIQASPSRPATTADVSPSAAATTSMPLGPSASSTAPRSQPTMDPVASELDQINQLINDLNNSVQSSDSSQQGGE